MGASEATRQSDNFIQPVQGKCLTITVDTTSRTYDTADLQWFDRMTTDQKEKAYLTLSANGAKVYYCFSNLSATAIDETAAVAAGGTLAFANTYSDVVFDGTKEHIRWDRAQYRYLVVKGAGAAKLHIRASSPPNTGAIKTLP